MSFIAALSQARQALRDAGYSSAQLEVHISNGDVDCVSHEFGVIQKVIWEAIHPDPSAPQRPGSRLLVIVDGVRVYVKDS